MHSTVSFQLAFSSLSLCWESTPIVCKHQYPSLGKDYSYGGSEKNLREFCYGADVFSADVGMYLIKQRLADLFSSLGQQDLI